VFLLVPQQHGVGFALIDVAQHAEAGVIEPRARSYMGIRQCSSGLSGVHEVADHPLEQRSAQQDVHGLQGGAAVVERRASCSTGSR
jgi:hypothetical protein